ncbi:MAG: hypothetical protein RR365_04655 [Bacteroides sp.]
MEIIGLTVTLLAVLLIALPFVWAQGEPSVAVANRRLAAGNVSAMAKAVIDVLALSKVPVDKCIAVECNDLRNTLTTNNHGR